MKNNTKKYIKEMLEDLEIQLNTVQFELYDVVRTRRKLQKFYKKIIKNC